MKPHRNSLILTIIANFIILLTPYNQAFAQDRGQLKRIDDSSLRVESVNSEKQCTLIVGERIGYRLRSSESFAWARVAGFTDTTVLLTTMGGRDTIIQHRDLIAFKVSRSVGRKIGGAALITIGAIALLNGASDSGQGSDPTGIGGAAKQGSEIIGVPFLVAGVALWFPKLVKLESLPASNTQYKKIKLGVGVGFAGPYEGTALYIEPAYRVLNSLTVGVKYESVSGKENITSFSLNSQYYFSNDRFRPFLGMGIGSYSPGGVGFYPRIGFDYDHFNLTFDYNIIKTQTETVYYLVLGGPTVGSYPSEKKYSYFGLKFGFSFGGGRK